MATLKSEIILAQKIRMDRSYKNVLNYTQTQFLSLVRSSGYFIDSRNDYSFIRENNSIFTDFDYSTAIKANYIAFQNKDYSNKWFFAWIDEVIYKGESNVEIKYTIDYWSTWFSSIQKKSCFVVREHVSDDTIGLHTVDENLDVGEMICLNEEKFFDSNTYYVAIMTTHDPTYTSGGTRIGKDFNGVSLFNSNFFGNIVFLFKIDITSSASIEASVEPIIQFLEDTATDKSGDLSCIYNMFIVPDELIPTSNLTLVQYGIYLIYKLKYTDGADIKDFFVDAGDYTPQGYYAPKNNKCYCYPYNYLHVTNNSGNDNIYRYEDFEKIEVQQTNSIAFRIVGALSIGYSAKLIPIDYRNVQYNTSESIPLGKYPTCGWAGDAYINWLTQNAVNIPLQILGLGQNAVNSGFDLSKKSASVSTSVGSGYSLGLSVLNVIGEFKESKLLPNIAHGGNTGDVDFANNDLNFTFRRMRCKDEFMRQVDNYFFMFGYKINEIKNPNLNSRENFNFIQIGEHDVIGYGDIPEEASELINNILRRGVTIWHHGNTFGNYSLSNNIVS